MVRAAVDGSIDLSCDLRDPMRIRNLSWRLAEVGRREYLKLLELLHNRHLTYLTCPKIDGAAANRIAEKEADTFGKIVSSVLESGDTQADRRAGKAATLRKAWARRFGDPSDPAVQAMIEATAKALRDVGERRT